MKLPFIQPKADKIAFIVSNIVLLAAIVCLASMNISFRKEHAGFLSRDEGIAIKAENERMNAKNEILSSMVEKLTTTYFESYDLNLSEREPDMEDMNWCMYNEAFGISDDVPGELLIRRQDWWDRKGRSASEYDRITKELGNSMVELNEAFASVDATSAETTGTQ